MRLQLKRYPQILRDMIVRVVASTQLSDITDSSKVKYVLASAAQEIEYLYYRLVQLSDIWSVRRAAGDDLDERAQDFVPSAIARLGVTPAVGLVVLSRGTNPGTTVNFPAGVTAKATNGLTYRTTQQASISAASSEQIAGHGVGRDSTAVSAVCTVPGAAGNADVGAIVGFASKPAGADAITNVTAFSGGRDLESDDDFRARILDYAASLSRCTPFALEKSVRGLEYTDPTTGVTKRVVFAHLFEDMGNFGNCILYVDDGAGTAAAAASAFAVAEVVTQNLAGPPPGSAVGGEEFLDLQHKPVWREMTFLFSSSLRGALSEGNDYLINPALGRLQFLTPLLPGEVVTGSYVYFTKFMALIQKTIDGDESDRINFPGFRPAGSMVRVLPPTVVVIQIAATLTYAAGAVQSTVITKVQTAVSDYVNALGISGDVVRNTLIERIMDVPGVYDLSLTLPTGNITVLDHEIARTSTASMSIV